MRGPVSQSAQARVKARCCRPGREAGYTPSLSYPIISQIRSTPGSQQRF
jgi:hypothetical protein